MPTCKEDGVIKNYGRKNSKRCGLCVTFRESPRFGRFRLVKFHWVEITEMDATSNIGKRKRSAKAAGKDLRLLVFCLDLVLEKERCCCVALPP